MNGLKMSIGHGSRLGSWMRSSLCGSACAARPVTVMKSNYSSMIHQQQMSLSKKTISSMSAPYLARSLFTQSSMRTTLANRLSKAGVQRSIRMASTNASTSTAVTSTAKLSWKEFFEYRKSVKSFELSGMVIGGIAGFSLGMIYFMMIAEFDPTNQLFGLQDPTVLYFMAVFLTAAIGAVSGGQLGLLVRRLTKSKEFINMVDQRESDFYKRIEKYRPKEIAAVVPIPGAQQSGMPDYYGEKIFSIKDYRDWLRKQRKFINSRKLRRSGL